MKTGRTLQELAIELDRQSGAKRDFVVESGALHMDIVDEQPELRIGAYDAYEAFGLNEIAHRQVGQHLKIPAQYYDRMRHEDPGLLATNVNHWLSRQLTVRRMVRTMDGVARAFLSDRYRRIDNYEVAQAVLPIIGAMDGASVVSCELTDSRMYLKVVNPRIQAEVNKGDVVQAGILITNSEVGQGSVTVSPLIYRLVCTNGMIAEDGRLRKYHVGKANEVGEDYTIFRDETVEADDRAFLMKIEDTVRAAVDQVRFEQIVDRMREATQVKMRPQDAPKVIELAATEYRISQDESKGILGHLIDGGDLSLYGVGNAVTRFSQDVESYDRATELETLGWRIMTMPHTLWRRLNAAAV